MLQQTDGRLLHFTATAMERVPLLLSSKSAVTYLVDTVIYLGIAVSISCKHYKTFHLTVNYDYKKGRKPQQMPGFN